MRTGNGIEMAVVHDTSLSTFGFSVRGCRIVYELNNKIIQPIRSIAIVFPHSLIFPRRLI